MIVYDGIFGFILKMFVCAFVPNIIYLLLFFRSKEFKYLFNIFKSRILKI